MSETFTSFCCRPHSIHLMILYMAKNINDMDDRKLAITHGKFSRLLQILPSNDLGHQFLRFENIIL